MNHFKITSILIIAIGTIGLQACVNSNQLTKRQDFVAYLDQFKGKTQNQLKQELNFKQFGFDASKTKIGKQNQSMMQYRIHRPIALPIPMFEPNYGASGGGASGMRPTLHTSANSYEVDMTCDITFHLENQIVTSWEAKGKAC
ncbi:hypothetical protein MKI79_05330 [Acinetobacter sp. A3.8]|uniref:Lipoprotein n=1 Tax=Acinetobacter sedimenti TaxID=2919922 RepID=A0A9X1WW73_9GAMM|nr:hypothetical protein [Acinetobacter sedimenti]MCJ8146324.1 hypothetical protein [Acinetobacter sedimenti]